MPSSWASSSIDDSSAKEPDASPGARMKVGVPRFMRARRWVVSWCGTSYIMRVIRPLGSIQSSIIEV
jgi:hypothetical protein